MQAEIDQYRRRDVGVFAIGQGTGAEARRFARKWGVDFPVLGDPSAVAYQAYGMLRGSWWTILFRSLLMDPVRTITLTLKADIAGAALPAADVLRLGGVAIVAKGGALRFLHRALEPADIPPNEAVLAALDAL